MQILRISEERKLMDHYYVFLTSPVFLMTVGLCHSCFDLEHILQCDLSGLAELWHNFQEIAEWVPLARPFLFIWHLTFSNSLSLSCLGEREQEGERKRILFCSAIDWGFKGWKSLWDADQNKHWKWKRFQNKFFHDSQKEGSLCLVCCLQSGDFYICSVSSPNGLKYQ